MIKRVCLLLLSACLMLTLVSPPVVQAQSKLEVLGSSVRAEFPARLTFDLSARSNVSIVDIRLRYRIERLSFAQVISEAVVEFAPAMQVQASWTMDMVKTGGFPPGIYLDYWWLLRDANGQSMETPPQRFQYNDTRYPWRNVAQGQVTIYYYEGGQSFVQGMMSAAQDALVKLEKDTGAHLDKPVSIYIYASASDLQGSMIFPQEWTGGRAFPDYGVIAIGIASNQLSEGKRTVAHELAHQVVYQVTASPYRVLPTWLDEGLAMYIEGELESIFKLYMGRAVADKQLISVRSLSSPFSTSTAKALLSYAESYSLVEFLIRNYGQSRMLELLNTFKLGSTFDDAFRAVYGFDMDGLDVMWKDYMYGGSK